MRLLARERETRRLLVAVLEQLPIAVLVASPDGSVLFRNAGVAAILGDGLDPVATGADGRRLAPGDWPLARSLATGAAVADEEIAIERHDGSHIVIAASSGPVIDEAGAIVAAVVTYSDITGRKDAERLRDAFIGVLSHELRTPMTSILGAAMTLRRHADALPEVDRELVMDVAVEAERLRRVIDDLVVVARVGRGAALADAEPVSLRQRGGDGGRGRADALAPRCGSSSGHRTGCPRSAGEAGLVDQVLRNLLSNAAKYGGAGRVDVEVRAGCGRPRGGGPRARPGPRPRGRRGRGRSSSCSTARRSPHGRARAGVGLFVSRALVEAMGGRIWARPRRGGGAEFGFSLPIIGDEEGDDA